MTRCPASFADSRDCLFIPHTYAFSGRGGVHATPARETHQICLGGAFSTCSKIFIGPDQLDFLLLEPSGSFWGGGGGVDFKTSAHARVLNVNL